MNSANAVHSLFCFECNIMSKRARGYNCESLAYADSITQWSAYDRCLGYTVLAHRNAPFLKTYLDKEG